MPSAVKTPRDEALWERAKAQAAKQGHEKDYAYIMGIYQRMKKSSGLVLKAGYAVGTVRQRRDGEYVKTAPGKWKRRGWMRLGSAQDAVARVKDELHKLPESERKSLKRLWVSAHEFGLPRQTVDRHARDTGKKTAAGDPIRVYSPARQKLHQQLVDHYTAGVKSAPPDEAPLAIVMMGGGGSGKGTIKKIMLGDKVKDMVNVDPDDLKGDLPEYKKAMHLADVDGKIVTAKDAAWMAHEESSDIAGKIEEAAIRARNFPHVHAAVEEDIEVVDRRIAVVSIVRLQHCDERAQRSGRFVPLDILREAHTKIPGNFETVAKEADEYRMYRSERPPILMWSGGIGKEPTIHSPSLVSEFKQLVLTLGSKGGIKKSEDRVMKKKAFPFDGDEIDRRITDAAAWKKAEAAVAANEKLDDYDGRGGVVEVIDGFEAETAAYLAGLKDDITNGGIKK
jgi:predicted ABC-type ATPase